MPRDCGVDTNRSQSITRAFGYSRVAFSSGGPSGCCARLLASAHQSHAFNDPLLRDPIGRSQTSRPLVSEILLAVVCTYVRKHACLAVLHFPPERMEDATYHCSCGCIDLRTRVVGRARARTDLSNLAG
jgi:hypothetical protein